MSVIETVVPPSDQLNPVVEEELQRFEKLIAARKSEKLDPNEFKKFRLNNGVYGIRDEEFLHMIRVKCKHGELTADQLEILADLTEKYTRLKKGHVTTRQAIQIHHVHIDNVVHVLRRINESGLTTREACGNTVRNVTKSPYAGFLPDEVFDVTPYAEAIFQNYLRNPICQNFGRKFKIALWGGGKEDVAYTAIHDVGLVAAKKIINGKEVKGFHVYLGGGLGASPYAAIPLEDFTPLDELYPTIDAVMHIFDRNGDRKDKFHARLKFVVKKFGEETFRKMVFEERMAVRATRAGGWKWVLPEEKPPAPPAVTPKMDGPVNPGNGFELWRKTNAIAQKQAGYFLAVVVTPLGDISHTQMRQLARVARNFNGGQLRTMVQQNFVLPWIQQEHLAAVYAELERAGLAGAGALRLADITRCPGADTCQIAVTKSRGLAAAIGELFTNGLAPDLDMKGLQIKISGCTNSCGHHHIGNIGFFGTYRKINGKEVPHYQLLIGGETGEGLAKFGQPVAAIPARRGPEVVQRLVKLFKKEKQGEETFVQTMNRLGRQKIKAEVAPFQSLPSFEENPALYYDWTEDHEFKAKIGQGECAA